MKRINLLVATLAFATMTTTGLFAEGLANEYREFDAARDQADAAAVLPAHLLAIAISIEAQINNNDDADYQDIKDLIIAHQDSTTFISPATGENILLFYLHKNGKNLDFISFLVEQGASLTPPGRTALNVAILMMYTLEQQLPSSGAVMIPIINLLAEQNPQMIIMQPITLEILLVGAMRFIAHQAVHTRYMDLFRMLVLNPAVATNSLITPAATNPALSVLNILRSPEIQAAYPGAAQTLAEITADEELMALEQAQLAAQAAAE